MSYVNPYLAKMEISNLSTEERRDALDHHYTQLRKFVKATCENRFHLIVNGDAGMGKTEITHDVVDDYAEGNVLSISGTISSVRLFGKFQEARKKKDIIIIDDTDKILEDQESLEVLKAVLDTREGKIVDWDKYSTALQKSNIKSQFKYEGRCIIITNKQLRTAPDANPTIQQQRILPVLSRCHYFKAGVPSNQWKIESIRMHQERYKSKYDKHTYVLRCFENVHPDTQLSIVDWLEKHADDLREISFRTCAMLVQLQEQEPDFWEEMAESSLGY